MVSRLRAYTEAPNGQNCCRCSKSAQDLLKLTMFSRHLWWCRPNVRETYLKAFSIHHMGDTIVLSYLPCTSTWLSLIFLTQFLFQRMRCNFKLSLETGLKIRQFSAALKQIRHQSERLIFPRKHIFHQILLMAAYLVVIT